MTPITTPAEAEKAIDDLTALIEKLTGIVEQETVLVRAGELRNASALEPAKAQLAGQLYVAGERLKANAKFFLKAAPGALRRAGQSAGKLPRGAAKEHGRAGDGAFGLRGHHAAPVGRSRSQSVAADLWRDRTRHGAKSQARPPLAVSRSL